MSGVSCAQNKDIKNVGRDSFTKANVITLSVILSTKNDILFSMSSSWLIRREFTNFLA